MNPFLRYNQNFVTFGGQHLWVLLFLLAFGMLCIGLGKYRWNRKQQENFARYLALSLSLTVIVWIIIRLALGDFDHTTDLPLDICNISALLLPFLMWKPNYRVFEVLVFWVLLGTMVALFTPHLINGFPNFTFFKYWIVHGGLVIYFLYLSIVLKFKPQRKSIWKSFLALQLYVVFVLLMNLLLNSNYAYLLGKPPTASPIDFLGPWPWYILVLQLIALLFFSLIYLVYQWSSRKEKDENVPSI